MPTDRSELFALEPGPTVPEGAHLALPDDEHPGVLFDGGPLAPLHARVLERAYVWEAMAETVLRLRFDSGATDDRDPYLRAEGARDLVASLAHRHVPGGAWRGQRRLDLIANRVLLARSRMRLVHSERTRRNTGGSESAYEAYLTDKELSEARNVYTHAALELGRDPHDLTRGPF